MTESVGRDETGPPPETTPGVTAHPAETEPTSEADTTTEQVAGDVPAEPVRIVDPAQWPSEPEVPTVTAPAAVDAAAGTEPTSAADATSVAEPTADVEPPDTQSVVSAAPEPSPVFTAPEEWPTDWVTFGFNLGKIEGHGEDSDPILLLGPATALVAVFDGMGGAGGTVYQTPDGPHTGAYLASRIARDVVEQVMQRELAARIPIDPAVLAETLRHEIRAALELRVVQLKAPRSGLRSTLIRTLPTTMSVALLQRSSHESAAWTCHLFWAGDSRIYLIDPVEGAGQLTEDDIRDRSDALANLRVDSVLSNAISADTAFTVNFRTVELVAPFLVAAATDGCFGYLPTPMHFEHLLLSSLRDTTDADEWSTAVQRRVNQVTGDDAAMAVIGIGGDHEGFRSMFDDRTNDLENSFVRPLDALRFDVDRLALELDLLQAKQREATADLWAAYQPSYERFQDSTRSKQEES